MELGDAVLTLTINEDGLVSGFARAKDSTEEFVEKNDETSGKVDASWAATFTAVVAGAAAAVIAFNKIIAIAGEMLDAFAVQERATTTLTLALSTNKNATDDTALALHNWAGEMQKTTIFGDELTEQNLVLLAGMGMTEDEMKRVMTAAMNLSAVYNIQLDQAVRGLALSLESGTTGMLSRYIPTMRAFTKEQLMAGEAINWTERQFTGAAAIIGDTTAGLQIRMANLIGDQKEKIGEAISATYAGVESLMESIDAIGSIAAIATGILVKSLITLAEWFRWQYDVVVGFFKLLVQLTIDVARVIWIPLQYGFEIVMQTVKIAFVSVLNWVLDQAEAILRKIGEGLSAVSGGLLGKGLMAVDIGQVEVAVQKIKPIGEALAQVWSDAKTQSEEFLGTIVKGANNMADIWSAKAPNVADSIKKVQDAVGEMAVVTAQATVVVEDMTRQAYEVADAEYIFGEALRSTAEMSDAYAEAMHRAAMSVQQDERDTANLFLDTSSKEQARKDEAYKKEQDRQARLKSLIVSTSKSIFEAIGQDIAAGELSWASLGTAGVRAIGNIVSAMGDELAASAASDLIKAFAAAASILMAWAAPGLFQSAAIKSIGAAAAWTTGAVLKSVSFAQGGEFTVPPGYPNDSFPMRVESGERVKVTPAGEAEDEATFRIGVYLDSRPILDAVARASRNRQLIIDARAVRS